MRQGQVLRPILLPIADGLGQICAVAIADMPIQRICAEQDRQFDLRHRVQQGPSPMAGTFRSRRGISATSSAGETKAHRHDRYFGRIIKDIFADTQPCTQPFTAGVIKWPAFGMGNAAGRLPDNQDFCVSGCLNDWLGTKRQIRAQTALSDLGDQLVD